MKNNIIIMTADEGTVDEARELVERVFKEFVAPDYVERGVTEFMNYITPQAMRERLAAKRSLFIAKTGGVVVGVLEMKDPEHISLLFVDASYQRRGIAGLLFRFALENYVKAQGTQDKITVNSSLYAVEIYKRLGFIQLDDEREINGIRFVPMEKRIFDL